MILVDRIRHYPNCGLLVLDWCHMVSDVGLEELHEIARAMGLRQQLFDADHYDLPPWRREQAVRLGALEVGSKELVRRMVPRRRIARAGA